VLLATTVVAFGARVSAHRLDEFLQAARIAVERDRVQLEMTLTPGMAVADDVIREIDADRNGVLSQEEGQLYASRVLSALTLRVDDALPLHLQLAGSSVPAVTVLRAGDGAIIIRSEAVVPYLPVGPHRLFFHNMNAAGNSVYLANALVPEDDDVGVTGQQHAGDQSQLTIEFVVRETSAFRGHWGWIGLAGAFALAVSLTRRRSIA
jgi:hypothetical protein